MPPIQEVVEFGDGATLDVPGSPRVIAVPGHSPGSAALHVPSLDALFVGDALATLAVTTGETGAQIAPVLLRSRPRRWPRSSRLDGIEAAWLLPGHGEPWTAGVGAASAAVRQRGSWSSHYAIGFSETSQAAGLY